MRHCKKYKKTTAKQASLQSVRDEREYLFDIYGELVAI